MSQQNEISNSLKKIVDLVNDSEISSIKNVVSGILKIINDPKSTAKDLKELIEIDPPLTAHVLKVANSAYYCPPSRIGEILKAVLWIGFEAIKELALNQKVCSVFSDDKSTNGYSRLSLWKHSVAVAVMGKMIYRREFGEKGENIYAAGLLHDIGLIVVDQFRHQQFIDILEKSAEEETEFTETEQLVFGFDHAELGREVMSGWDMPEELCYAIGQHHSPDPVSRFRRMTCTLYLADTMCQERKIGHSDSRTFDKGLFIRCMREAGVERRGLDLIIDDVEEQIRKMERQGLFG
ncbi:MAG: HDOD domain-containing protein [Desulfobacteraceae bacterium]|nr:MAG: HDOD domain-containing protein [Desulfobacteraceae bacterium]